MSRVMRCVLICGVLSVLPFTSQAQQQQDLQELLAQAGVASVPLDGTWVYPVRGGLHTQFLEEQDFGSSRGVDADFVAKASVVATRTVRGPDLCNPGEKGASDFRLIAMQPETESGSLTGREQGSRLVVHQKEERVVLYVFGEVREWKPGPEFCGGERQMLEANRGPGTLRLEYATQGHLAPLHFSARPRSQSFPNGEQGMIGTLTWKEGSVDLLGRVPVPGAPVAMATGPVQSTGSVADALALARQMSGGEDIPSAADIQAQLPEGVSLDGLPIQMTGQGEAGPIVQGVREWFLSFHVDLIDAGEKLSDDWSDPWRQR